MRRAFEAAVTSRTICGHADAFAITRGFFAFALEVWMRSWPRDRLLVLSMSGLTRGRHANAHLRRLLKFVGLGHVAGDGDTRLTLPRANEGGASSVHRVATIECSTRRALAAIFAPANDHLVSMLAAARRDGSAPPEEPPFEPFVVNVPCTETPLRRFFAPADDAVADEIPTVNLTHAPTAPRTRHSRRRVASHSL